MAGASNDKANGRLIQAEQSGGGSTQASTQTLRD